MGGSWISNLLARRMGILRRRKASDQRDRGSNGSGHRTHFAGFPHPMSGGVDMLVNCLLDSGSWGRGSPRGIRNCSRVAGIPCRSAVVCWRLNILSGSNRKRSADRGSGRPNSRGRSSGVSFGRSGWARELPKSTRVRASQSFVGWIVRSRVRRVGHDGNAFGRIEKGRLREGEQGGVRGSDEWAEGRFADTRYGCQKRQYSV